jgi:hypothetical protein
MSLDRKDIDYDDNRVSIQSWMKTPEEYYDKKFPKTINEDNNQSSGGKNNIVHITAQILYNLSKHAQENRQKYNADELLDILMLWCKDNKCFLFEKFDPTNYEMIENVREILVNIDSSLEIEMIQSEDEDIDISSESESESEDESNEFITSGDKGMIIKVKNNQIYDYNDKKPNPEKLWYFWNRKNYSAPIMNIYFRTQTGWKNYIKNNKESLKSTIGKIGIDFFVAIAKKI